jgi:N-acetylglucosamine-6-phosphate deacetylase
MAFSSPTARSPVNRSPTRSLPSAGATASPSRAIVNARVMTEEGLLPGLAVLLDGERIAAVVPETAPQLAGLPRHDLGGLMLLPGFIDTQCNGGGGVLFNNEPTVESLRIMAATHRRFGTTGLLPTLITDTAETMRAAVAALSQAIAEGVPGILGIHLEGPFLNTERKGIHDARKFRLPDEADIALITASPGVTLVTVAPERVPAATIRQLAEAGVIVAAGHTAADFDMTRDALRAGVRGFTHLFNAMTPLTSRTPGAVGAALDDPHSWCGVIVDGHHVHPASLRVAIAAKPRGKIMLVTDAMPPVGAEESEFLLDGRAITRDGLVCKSADGTLAGSALDMSAAVRNAVRLLNLPLAEASRMASAYPAEFLGLAGDRGRIASGQRADFAVLDDDLSVRQTWIAGQPDRIDALEGHA